MAISNEQAYNKIADAWAKSRSVSRVPDLVKEFAALLKPGDKVLDIGCGSGLPNASYLHNQGLDLVGTDISEKLVKKAVQNVPNAQFIKADINLYETQEKFDGILAWDSLFHLQPSEHKMVFEKLKTWLKPDGYLLFTHGGKKGQLTGEMYGEQFSYSSLGPAETKNLLTSMDFKIIKWQVDNADNGYLIALVRR